MADFHYNRLRNTRIKSIFLGLVVIAVDVLIIGFYLSLAGDEIKSLRNSDNFTYRNGVSVRLGTY